MSRKFFTYSALLASLVTAAALAGCGSDSRESGASLDSVAKVGDTACVQCHSAVTEALTGESIVTQYQQNSPHNQDGLGCESCHGGGALHNGVGPIPYPAPDANRCAACHDGVSSFTVAGVATVAPATNANTEFATSNHATGTPSHTSTALCTRCHTHETAVLSNQTGYTGELASGTVEGVTYPGVLDNAAYGPPVVTTGYTAFKCETCHQHGAGLRGIKARDINGNVVLWNPSKSGLTDQFNLCTSCHNLYNYNQTRVIASNTAVSGTLKYEHNTRWNRTLVTTHKEKTMVTMLRIPFANMTSPDGNNTQITGYAIRLTNTTDASYKGPCFDCHGHEAKTNTGGSAPTTTATIHTDWAQSGHAGGLLTAKYTAGAGNLRTADEVDAVTAAYVDTTTSTWSHYNWDNTTSRGSCQRCHTATGVSNFLTSPSTYDSANNSFTHLAGWTSTTKSSTRQNELLYCWGCHKDAGTGALRNPGAITENYTPATTGGPVVTVTYPNIAGSNVCMACHLGRETGDNIKTDIDADGTRSFINSHYLSAGGQLFATTGYEYDGLNYANPTAFQHDAIGSSAAAGTGTNGPCVGCHMKTANAHSFLPVTKDGTGAITAINSTSCATCHTGASALTPAGLTTLEEEYQAALEALKAALAAKGIHFFEAHPYFYNGAGGTGGAYTTWATLYGLAGWKNTMGAAFNANLLIHDPGGYAHNSTYSRRLIWDATDWIDDGILNNSTIATIQALETGGSITPTISTEAQTYLGTSRP